MTLAIASLKDHVKGFFAGLVDSLGEISPAVKFVPTPDRRNAAALVRHGYEVRGFDGPKINRRTHQIEDAGSLAAWLQKHADAATTEILVSDDQIVAALRPADINSDIVKVPLAPHPRWKRWAALLGEEPKIGQRKLHRHVLACAQDFPPQPIEGGGATSAGEALAMQLAKFNAVRSQECTCEVDELGYVRFAAAAEKTQITGRLPPKFKIRVPLFLGVEKSGVEPIYELELFLTVEPAEKGPPAFGLTCPELEVVRRTACLDVVEHLRAKLEGDGSKPFLVGVGKYETIAATAEIAS